jgi:hypothetical protein
MPQPSTLDTTTREARIEIEHRNQLHAPPYHFRSDFKQPFELGPFCSIANFDGLNGGGPVLL